jgi:hypothetical protein
VRLARLRVLVIASLILSAGCQRQADPPADAPAGMAVAAGDGLVLVSWVQVPDPNLTYWIFYQAGGSVTAAAPGVPIIRNAQSPRVVANLTNGTQYALVMNATNRDSPAGPSTPVMTATPQLAGANWTAGAPLGTTPLNLNGIAFNGRRFVVVGDAGAIFAGDYNYASTNLNPPGPPGVTAWTPVVSVWWASQLTGVVPNLSAVIFSGAQFVALSADGSILTSTDGFTWTFAGTVPAAGASMNGLAFGSVSGAAVYVAVGAGGAMFTSPDLVNWTPRASNPVNANDLFGVAFLNGGFVATGANGTLLTSPDGSNWTGQVSGTLSALRSAAFGVSVSAGSRYVAVGDGTIVTSTDALSWTPIPASNLRSVTFGSRFVAVGQGGALAYSDDGVNWSTSTTGIDLNRVIFAPGMYVAVGAAGANAVSK